LVKDFSSKGGGGLLHKYDDSLFDILSTLYPEHEWIPWKFVRVPRSTWNDENKIKKYLEAIGKELGIKELSDWNKVTTRVTVSKNSTLTNF
jgi:hypothetical protein